MTYKEIGEANVSNAADIFVYAADIVPLFVPLVLFVFFMVALMGSYFSQQRLGGRVSFASSFAVAGYVTSIVAFAMSLITDLVNKETLTVVVVIAILGTLFLLSQQER